MLAAFGRSYHFWSDLIFSASPHQFQWLHFRKEIPGRIHERPVVLYCAGNWTFILLSSYYKRANDCKIYAQHDVIAKREERGRTHQLHHLACKTMMAQLKWFEINFFLKAWNEGVDQSILLYEKYIHKTEQYLQNSCATQGREQRLHCDLQYEKHQYRFSGFSPFKNRTSLNTEEHSDAHSSTPRLGHERRVYTRRKKKLLTHKILFFPTNKQIKQTNLFVSGS